MGVVLGIREAIIFVVLKIVIVIFPYVITLAKGPTFSWNGPTLHNKCDL